ncbi:hypothetical protein I4U23_007051 [Adineta vaga]|nr:hypothetical protein I4U23_007051 [Adineta vaga]
MSTKKKQDTNIARNAPTSTNIKQPISFSNRNNVKTQKSISTKQKTSRPVPILLPYVPPDGLMSDLFNAIQRRAWARAKSLCYELILCDPYRKNYYDLYERIVQIIKINNERRRPRQYMRRIATASSDSSDQTTTNRR